jgi:SAM-dependent methyltransferase
VKVREVLGRSDYALITELIPQASRVLDLGCGDGALLAFLQATKGVEARGIELRPELVQVAIARGVPVYQGDVENSLSEYPDKAFDYVILSQTVQETRRPLHVLTQMLRIASHAIIAFPNFGHWHDSPNIHFLTVLDFEELVRSQGWRIERRFFLSGTKRVSRLPNFRAEIAVYMLTN